MTPSNNPHYSALNFRPLIEEDITECVLNEGYSPRRIDHQPHYIYPLHHHSHSEILICLSGAMTVLCRGLIYPLAPGSRLVIPPGVSHAAAIGPCGCSFLYAR